MPHFKNFLIELMISLLFSEFLKRQFRKCSLIAIHFFNRFENLNLCFVHSAILLSNNFPKYFDVFA
jgi:hypothetical protein